MAARNLEWTYSPDQEVYSIDECILGLAGFGQHDLAAYGHTYRSALVIRLDLSMIQAKSIPD